MTCTSKPHLCNLEVWSEPGRPPPPGDEVIDIVILGDSFTESEMDLYRKWADETIDVLRNPAPGHEMISLDHDRFRFHRVDVISRPTSSMDGRPFGALGGLRGSITVSCELDILAWFAAAANAPDADSLIILMNDANGGGLASYPLGRTRMKGGITFLGTGVDPDSNDWWSKWKPGALPHEFAHAVFGLADEYLSIAALKKNWTIEFGGHSSAYYDFCHTRAGDAPLVHRPNITWEPTGDKFARRAQVEALFEGAGGIPRCAWRAAENCVMRQTWRPLCPVCRGHVEHLLREAREGDLEPPCLAAGSSLGDRVVAGDWRIAIDAFDTFDGYVEEAFLLDGAPPPAGFIRPSGGNTIPDSYFDLDTRLVADGDHLLSVSATDSAGNTEGAEVLFRVSNAPDVDPPKISIATPVDGAVVAAPLIAEALVVDDVYVRWVGLEVEGLVVALGVPETTWFYRPPYRREFDFTSLDSGPQTVRFTASDHQGNTTSQQASFILDKLPPRLSLHFAPVGDRLSVVVGVQDDVGIATASLRVNETEHPLQLEDGGARRTMEFDATEVLKVAVFATDVAGRSAMTERTYTPEKGFCGCGTQPSAMLPHLLALLVWRTFRRRGTRT